MSGTTGGGAFRNPLHARPGLNAGPNAKSITGERGKVNMRRPFFAPVAPSFRLLEGRESFRYYGTSGRLVAKERSRLAVAASDDAMQLSKESDL
jgi:hypothetical protein